MALAASKGPIVGQGRWVESKPASGDYEEFIFNCQYTGRIARSTKPFMTTLVFNTAFNLLLAGTDSGHRISGDARV
jgi:hypothetical protein